MRPGRSRAVNPAASSAKPSTGSPPLAQLARGVARPESERTRASSVTSSTGLVRKSSAPASRPDILASRSLSAVIRITGISAVAGSDLSLRQTSRPDMSGITTSSRIRSGRLVRAVSRGGMAAIRLIDGVAGGGELYLHDDTVRGHVVYDQNSPCHARPSPDILAVICRHDPAETSIVVRDQWLKNSLSGKRF